MVGPDHRTRLRSPHLLECAKTKKVDPPIHSGYFYTGGATTLIFIVDGGNTFNSFVMRSTIPWNMFVPLRNTTLAYKTR